MRKQDLYVLVNSLNAFEKKVFKEKHGGNRQENFIRLFDAITLGLVNNDEDVRKKFAGENFLKHLHKTKAYLYEALLDTLLVPLQDHFLRLQVFQKIQHAEVLQSRKLFSQAELMLLHGLELVKKTDDLELELLISNELLNFYALQHLPQREIKGHLQTRQNMSEYIKYSDFYLTIYAAYHQRGRKNGSSIESFSDAPLFNPVQVISGSKARRNLEMARGLVHSVQKKYELALENNRNIVTLSEGTRQTSTQKEGGYINSLFNLMLVQQGLNLSVHQPLKKLEKFQPYSQLGKTQKFICLARIKINAYLAGEKTAEGKKLIKWVLTELNEHRYQLNELELVKLYFSIASLMMKEKEFDRSLDYIFLIHNSKEARQNRTLIYRLTLLFQLIALYELGDFERLDGMLRNYKYFQKTDHAFYLIERMTLEFLNKTKNGVDKKKRDELKARFEESLLTAGQNETRSGLVYLQNIDWVRRK